ncbi:GNAT family N-acetyltransferase [Streptomyces mangrovisoli]|uniref:GNAT family N-acetyltransferase n=1 Tax=Streptomyces mangrovisoli TaxID=1428628 RepID=A0A1J4NN25_9ACTN|nr:GNAT family N-acetyltransferase [Streptomyces mangrovisoli]OIJ63707.1 GNAT family N-acetyltransferase [Streptomyces mangrovisoli]
MTSKDRSVAARTATAADIDAIVSTVTTAFFHDPLWGPAFPDERERAVQAAAMWRLYVTSALRYSRTLVTPDAEAVAVWIPPGGTELTPQETDELGPLLVRQAGAEVAEAILTINDQLAAAHPDEPCFYLTLLGVHDDHRGKGLGMGLLAESLARIDALGAPAYLESSNPSNNARYQSVGFTARDTITVATGHVITTMWRPGR